MNVRPYQPAVRDEWDAFVDASKNGTFLFRRAYMDYHADRFEDASLVVSDDNHQITAVFPANRKDDTITSHGGLTYGGFVTSDTATTVSVLRIADAVREFLTRLGVIRVRYKTIPRIYHRLAADEDLYALFRLGAAMVRRDVLTVVEPRSALRYESRRRRGVKRAEAAGLVVRESSDLAAYWQILRQNLEARHGVRPVHSEEEIVRLHATFPSHIRLFGAYAGQELLAGVLVYETDRVAHAQYIGSSPDGREKGALDLVFHKLISDVYTEKPYFDFGASTEEEGLVLNEGLVTQKEGFGGRTVVHDHYDWNLSR